MQLRQWIPTIVLVVILLSGGAYAYSQNFFQKDQSVPAEAKWISFTPNDVQRLEIRTLPDRKDATTASTSSTLMTLKKEQSQWHMIQPAMYPTNAYAIEDWLTTLQSATIHAIVDNHPTDVTKYGINPQQPTISLTTSGGKQNQLYIGSKLPTDGYYYARLNKGAIIQLAQQTVNDLSATVFGFIDTTPLGWDDQYMTALSWKGQKATANWTVTHQANIEDPTQDRWTFNNQSITSEQASNLTDSIKNIPTDQLPQPASQVQSKSPVFTLKVTRIKGGRTFIDNYQGFQSANDSAYVWVTDPSHTWAYRVPAEAIQNVKKAVQSMP